MCLPFEYHHQNKTVVYYYDTTALGANYAVNEQDFHWVVCHEFEKRGWQVEDVYLGNPMRHDEKYLLINQGFAGKQRLMPFFNRQNNDDLILAIQTAGVVRGRNGFRKDKGGEKLDETEENLLEHRTDGTDAFDTLFIGCEKFPQRNFILFLQTEFCREREFSCQRAKRKFTCRFLGECSRKSTMKLSKIPLQRDLSYNNKWGDVSLYRNYLCLSMLCREPFLCCITSYVDCF